MHRTSRANPNARGSCRCRSPCRSSCSARSWAFLSKFISVNFLNHQMLFAVTGVFVNRIIRPTFQATTFCRWNQSSVHTLLPLPRAGGHDFLAFHAIFAIQKNNFSLGNRSQTKYVIGTSRRKTKQSFDGCRSWVIVGSGLLASSVMASPIS